MEKSSHNFVGTEQFANEESLLKNMHEMIFNYCRIDNYKLNYVPVSNPNQSIYTLFIPYTNPAIIKKGYSVPTFYLGHGFGGSSFMFFPIFSYLLQIGNVVVWQVRGMGFSQKLQKYPKKSLEQIEQYFLQGVNSVLKFYRHSNVVMLCHSLAGYLALLHQIKIKQPQISKFILFSPVGLTRKQQDYRSQINSFPSLLNLLGHKFSWFFNLTYKSYLRTICGCCKSGVLTYAFKTDKMSQIQRQIMKQITLGMINDKDGSQPYFFEYFMPRVIPKIAIEPLIQSVSKQTEIWCYYGGKQDWVDKKGAIKLSELYPSTFHFKDINDGPGHMFIFDPELVKKLIKQSLCIDKQQVFQK